MINIPKLLIVSGFIGLSMIVLADSTAAERTRDIAERIFNGPQGHSDTQQFVRDFEELEQREKNGDASAKFYLALHAGQLCRLTENDELRTSSKLCTEAFTRMHEVADNVVIRVIWLGPASMEALAKMYFDGIGTKRSKSLASHCFTKAAKQNFDNGNTESALKQIEAALDAFPENGAALALRNEIFLSLK